MLLQPNNMPEPRIPWYEFFAGGGMARLGLGPGWKCTFANELSPKKAAAYRACFGSAPELKVADVAILSAADLPGRAALVWASFPCQDLSLAGNGAGLNGSRSGTYWPFWRLMEALIADRRKPRVIVLENVVGAITSHGGRDFAAILAGLAGAGYRFGPLVLDAALFLPQSRPRLFIVAADAAFEPPAGLIASCPEPWRHSHALQSARSALPPAVAESWVWWNLPSPDAPVPSLGAILEDDPASGWHSAAQTRHLLSLMSEAHASKVRQARESGRTAIGTVYRRTRPMKLDGHVARKTQRAEVRFDDISGCLRTPGGGSSRQTVLVVEPNRVRSRLLAPREAARLMGVPDEYPIPAGYSDAYHLFGDGVAVPVVSWLERHLLRRLVRQA
jgi:DNA (cytosine-5)-methyltransferase 1